MRGVILLLGLWLMGTGWVADARAFDLSRPETLHYSVAWGPLKVGDAWLDYAPAADASAYVLDVRVKDSSRLLDMDDTWKVRGVHGKGMPFSSRSYQALQKENDYRADKLVVFDPAAKRLTYTNRRDASDKVDPLPWDGTLRDVMSTIYAWRLQSINELKKPARVKVMGVKRPFTLVRGAAVREKMTLRGKALTVWRVPLGSEVNGKTHRDTWDVYLRDDATLAPVKVVSRNRFGSFNAVLAEN